MKKRLLYLLIIWGVFVLFFIIQKPLFMIYNKGFMPEISLTDYRDVIIHGLTLDISTAGYLILVPFLLTFVTIWFYNINIKKIFLIYYILIAIIVNVIFVVDTSLYSFWSFKLDATVLLYLDSPENAMASVSVWFILMRVIITILLCIFMVSLLYKLTPAQFPKIKLKEKLTGSISMILLGGILFISIRGGVSQSTANVGKAYYSSKQFLNHSSVNPLFSFLYSLGKTEDFAAQFNFFTESKREEIIQGLYPKDGETTKKLLTTNRPNIVIILLESFISSLIEIPYENKSITPNLTRLSEEGIFFNNLYANSFRTDRALVSTLSGYLGAPTVSIMKTPTKSQTLPSIAKELSNAGYKTDFLYGGDIAFTNMKGYFLSTGYQKLTSMSDFSLKEQQTHAWGVTDHITFDYLYNDITQKKDSLWHTGFLTLSSHDPFVVPYDKFDNKIINAFAYTDNSLGIFIDKLKATPIWDNLLIVLIADHGYPYPNNIERHEPSFFHIPMIWLGGAVKEPLKIETLMNQADLAATLLGQLELPHNNFDFSRDVFSSSYKYPFTFYSFNNGFSFQDSTGITVYDNTANSIILDSPNHNQERLNKGKAILQSLYDDLGKR